MFKEGGVPKEHPLKSYLKHKPFSFFKIAYTNYWCTSWNCFLNKKSLYRYFSLMSYLR